MTDSKDQRRYHDNLQDEVDGAALYKALAEIESDPSLAKVYRRLATVEDAHAEFWRARLHRIPNLTPSFRARALSWLAASAPAFLPLVAAAEARDSTHYDPPPEAVAGGLPADERSHARLINAAALPARAGLAGPALARLEGRHRGGGNALRAAVLGANDGLVSNLSLVMGVAGAEACRAARPAHGARRPGRGRLLDGDGRMAVGHQCARTHETADRDRSRGARACPRRRRRSWS